MCLNLLVEKAEDPMFFAGPSAPSLPDEHEHLVNATLSAIPPHREPAWFSPAVELTGFLHHPLLITGEPALVQLQLEDATHQRWQRHGAVPAAPFAFSRSLPLQI